MKKTSFFDGPAFISHKARGLAAAACAATALLSALPLTTHADDEAADRKAIAAEMNRKGFDLFKLVSEKDTKDNSFISPYSIDSAFGLVYCGASGKTAQEIRDTLGLPADPAECGKFFHEVSQEYEANKLIEVLVSNSVWYEQKYDDLILPSFIKMIGQYYGGTFFKEDFEKKDALVSKVNAYVEDHTKNMIRDLLSPSDISDKSFMILLNTLFFEAKWKTPFKKDDTKPMIFRNFDGKEKRVKMMYRRGRDIGYYSSEEDNVHAVVLPYEDTRFDLVALMPIQPGADRGEAAMNNIISKIGEKLDDWLKNRSPYETRLWLPIVDLTCKYSLKDALGELGMETPFDDKKADFFGIAQRSERLKYIWIEKVIHKTALKMDEEKTQAAAATAIIMGGVGGGFSQPPPVNIFRADRPYLVLIRDNQTGLILFAGRINDPGVEATEADGPVTPSFEGMPFPGFGMPPMQRSNGGFGPPVEGPARTTVPGAKPAAQTIPRQVTTTTKPGSATEQKSESAAAKVDGQISVILEGFIDGEDAFVFRDNKVFLQHKSYKEPAELTVNGKPWTDLSKPFELGFTPDPAETRFVCEGRGQKSMTRTDDGVTITIYDSEGAAACYRIILFQPDGVKEPLELPKDPVGNTVKEIPVAAKPATAAQTTKARTGESAATNVDGDRNDQDVFTMFETDSGKLTGAPLWNTERYGVPEIRLRELVGDAAKRAEADLRSLGAVRTISIDAERSTAEIDFTLVDEYSRIVRFIDEIEKVTPRLAWSRLEIRIEPARALAGQQAGAAPATTARQVRMTAQIRVIKYTPAKNKSVPAVGAAAPAEIKQKPGSSTGDPDFLAKLYDLSLSIPDDALVTQLRFTDMNCTLTIQASNSSPFPDRYLIFPYWKIGSLTQRILSNEVRSFSVGLVRVATSSPPHPGSVTAENKVAAIVARNIFDPERTNKKADRGKPAVLPGATTTPAAGQTASQTTMPVEPGVLVLEGTFDGRGVFLFMGSMIAYSNREGEYPAGVKIDGKPWPDLTKPLMLDAAAIPTRIMRKQARGTVTLLPADEHHAQLELNDFQDGSDYYRIEFATK